MNQKPLVGYASQFAILLGLMGVALIISSVLMGFLAAQLLHTPLLQAANELLKPENANLARLLNTAATFISFFIPAWAVARIVSKQPFVLLGFSKIISTRQLILVAVITFSSMFLSGSLGTLNELIPVPASFLKKAKALEEAYETAMLSMATMHSFGEYLLSLLVIAFAPALFEEVLFRGSMQQIFIGWTKNPWIGIIITSLVFSAIHGSYFGFLPRFALGIILGIIFQTSKNLWLSVLMHFLNNGVVATQIYILTLSGKPVKEAMNESMPLWLGLVGIAGLFLAFKLFRKESTLLKKNLQPSSDNEYMD